MYIFVLNKSPDECSVIAKLQIPNIVFFCSSCIPVIPTALRHYDNQSFLESKISTLEKSVYEINHTETKTCLSCKECRVTAGETPESNNIYA